MRRQFTDPCPLANFRYVKLKCTGFIPEDELTDDKIRSEFMMMFYISYADGFPGDC